MELCGQSASKFRKMGLEQVPRYLEGCLFVEMRLDAISNRLMWIDYIENLAKKPLPYGRGSDLR
jgi:hypothetical protein